MNRPPARLLAAPALGLALAAALGLAPEPGARSGSRNAEPSQVVPLELIAPAYRDSVAETIRDATLHRKGPADAFPCNSRIYLGLLNEPLLTLALWQDLASSPVRLHKLSANHYQGSDGAGASASWDFVHRSPKLHVLLSNIDYTSPRGTAHLEGRIVLVVRSGYYKEVNGQPYVQHDIEAFVKIDSKGWKAAARTARPVIEKLLEDQVREAGWFVSLMGRLVEQYPNWAGSVAAKAPQVDPEIRQTFLHVLAETRQPGASSGRPQMASNAAEQPRRR